MRLPLFSLLILAACATTGTTTGQWPVTNVWQNVTNDQRRGAVEIIVKSNFTDIRNDIVSGGGPILSQAMDTAEIPTNDRPARIIQLQSDMGLYENNPGALVTALVIYGS